MTKKSSLLPLVLLLSLSFGFTSEEWLTEKQEKYTLYFTAEDNGNKKEYITIVNEGLKRIQSFTSNNFKQEFLVYVHPNRASLDRQWQKDWGMPEFKSECWMVASGTGSKLDVISPKRWTSEACEHSYDDKIKTQQLITHELFHVYHGQLNASPDFSNTEGIDWFVEGFATYASGQCDAARMEDVKKAIVANTIPTTLDAFWTGKLRYGLSGSVVQYIDEKYGRKKLLELLPVNRKTEILSILNTTEQELLANWKVYMQNKK